MMNLMKLNGSYVVASKIITVEKAIEMYNLTEEEIADIKNGTLLDLGNDFCIEWAR